MKESLKEDEHMQAASREHVMSKVRGRTARCRVIECCAKIIHSTDKSIIGRALMMRKLKVLTRRIQRLSMETRSSATTKDQ